MRERNRQQRCFKGAMQRYVSVSPLVQISSRDCRERALKRVWRLKPHPFDGLNVGSDIISPHFSKSFQRFPYNRHSI